MGARQKSFALATAVASFPGVAAAVTIDIQGTAGHHTAFLFDNLWWVIFIAAFFGILLGSLWKRVDPFINGQQVLRHDGAARISHWTHAAGCTLLLGSGVALGFSVIPRLVSAPAGAAQMMNIHFYGAVLFVFGGFFWLSNTILSPWQFSEHMPGKGSLIEGITHYAHIFGLTKKTVRPAKYDGSERLAFVPIVLFAILLILSGFIKLAPRFIDVPTSLLSFMSWLHDMSALMMLVLFFFHVLLAAVVPWSWPLLKSMFNGWVPTDFAKSHHPVWYEQLNESNKKKDTQDKGGT
jgi:formate dehydrogenase subunit gamma